MGGGNTRQAAVDERLKPPQPLRKASQTARGFTCAETFDEAFTRRPARAVGEGRHRGVIAANSFAGWGGQVGEGHAGRRIRGGLPTEADEPAPSLSG